MRRQDVWPGRDLAEDQIEASFEEQELPEEVAFHIHECSVITETAMNSSQMKPKKIC